jgi:hypothetical protein
VSAMNRECDSAGRPSPPLTVWPGRLDILNRLRGLTGKTTEHYGNKETWPEIQSVMTSWFRDMSCVTGPVSESDWEAANLMHKDN